MLFEIPSTTPVVATIEPRWRLIAVGLDPSKTVPDLYVAIHEGDLDMPLMVDGRIVFFSDPARALIRRQLATMIAFLAARYGW